MMQPDQKKRVLNAIVTLQRAAAYAARQGALMGSKGPRMVGGEMASPPPKVPVGELADARRELELVSGLQLIEVLEESRTRGVSRFGW